MRTHVGRNIILILFLFSICSASINTSAAGPASQGSGKTIIPALDARPVQSYQLAADHVESFSKSIGPVGWQAYYAERTSGTGLYGDFTATDGIDFWICDQTNYDLWRNGYASSVYLLTHYTNGKDWEFKVPYTAVWYKVYYNYYSLLFSVQVSGHHCIDQTGPTLDCNLDPGSTYSGQVDITASAVDAHFGVSYISLTIDGTQVDIETDASFNYRWDTTGYSDGTHTLRFESADGVGNQASLTATVEVSNFSVILPAVSFIALLSVVGLAVIYKITRPTQPKIAGAHHPERPVTPGANFCPKCGAPVPYSGASFCSVCGASLGPPPRIQ